MLLTKAKDHWTTSLGLRVTGEASYFIRTKPAASVRVGQKSWRWEWANRGVRPGQQLLKAAASPHRQGRAAETGAGLRCCSRGWGKRWGRAAIRGRRAPSCGRRRRAAGGSGAKAGLTLLPRAPLAGQRTPCPFINFCFTLPLTSPLCYNCPRCSFSLGHLSQSGTYQAKWGIIRNNYDMTWSGMRSRWGFPQDAPGLMSGRRGQGQRGDMAVFNDFVLFVTCTAGGGQQRTAAEQYVRSLLWDAWPGHCGCFLVQSTPSVLEQCSSTCVWLCVIPITSFHAKLALILQ